MRPVKFIQTNVGIGGNGYLDYGCTNDASRPSGWNSLYVRAGAAGNGTKASPFGTITQAIVAAGSTRTVVCVASGNYAENIDLGMQRRQMLVGGLNSAFTARDALTTPTTVSAANANQHVMHAEAPAELVIDGFVVTGSNNRGIDVTAWDANERITLRNNHVHHNGCTTPTARTDCGGIDVGGGRTVVVEIANNLVEENGGGHHGGGINIGGGTENIGTLDQTTGANDGFGDVLTMTGLVAKVHHNVIRNNRLYEESLPHGAGMAIGMNGDVHHNLFFGNDTVSDGDHYGVGAGLIGQHDRGGSASVALLTVRNNWFEANRTTKLGSAIFLDQYTVGYVYNNVVVRNFGTGAIIVDGNCGDTCAGPNGNHGRNFVTILNNTVADNEGAGLAVQDSTAHVYFNIFWRNRDADVNGDIASHGRVTGCGQSDPRCLEHHRHRSGRLPAAHQLGERRRDLESVAFLAGQGLPPDRRGQPAASVSPRPAVRAGDRVAGGVAAAGGRLRRCAAPGWDRALSVRGLRQVE